MRVTDVNLPSSLSFRRMLGLILILELLGIYWASDTSGITYIAAAVDGATMACLLIISLVTDTILVSQ